MWERGVKPWVDEWEIKPGDRFAEKIHNAIQKAEAMVVVLSEHSVESPWVKRELSAGLVREVTGKMKLLPVVLDGLSEGRIPSALQDIQQVRVSADGHDDAAEKINRAMRGLRNPRQPPLGSASGQEFAMPESPPPALSLEVLRQMAAGDAIAQFHLGGMYHLGEGVPQDFAAAAKWTRRAAEQGFAQAQNNLGVMYRNGKGVPQDNAEAARWFRCAAEQEDAKAQFNLGQVHHNGEGVPRDDAEAAKWFRRAAEQGDPQAQNNLGVMYHKGEGTSRDDVEAVKWVRRAAEQGDPQAQCTLGVAYHKGEGVAPDDAAAAEWFRRAAEQGHAGAQDSIGKMHVDGRGVKQNWREAFIWFSLAANNKHKQAAEARKEAAKHLSSADLSAAKAEAARRHGDIQRGRHNQN